MRAVPPVAARVAPLIGRHAGRPGHASRSHRQHAHSCTGEFSQKQQVETASPSAGRSQRRHDRLPRRQPPPHQAPQRRVEPRDGVRVVVRAFRHGQVLLGDFRHCVRTVSVAMAGRQARRTAGRLPAGPSFGSLPARVRDALVSRRGRLSATHAGRTVCLKQRTRHHGGDKFVLEPRDEHSRQAHCQIAAVSAAPRNRQRHCSAPRPTLSNAVHVVPRVLRASVVVA
jgi:hypothetical protein